MRWTQAVAFLAAASTLLSGCLSGGDEGDDGEGVPTLPDASTLSQKLYGILPVEEIWVTASDAVVGETGTRLHNAVYRPDTDGPVPVFINFSPYWADTAMVEGDNFAKYLIHEYVPRGYAVVLSSIRGTGHSEGCFEVASDRESLDINEVVDFFANAEWSTGNVAAGGKSYDSTSQNGMIAKYPHAALKGIFHVSGITDMYSYTFRMGTPARSDSESFTTSYGVGQSLGEYGLPPPPLGTGGGSIEDEDADSLARLAGDACTSSPEGAASAGASTVAGARTPYWVERDWTRDIASSSWNGSIFFVHGFQDWNVQPSHILPWIDQVNANGKIRVLGWLHQWADQDEFECEPGNGHVYPMRTDWNETMLRWLDATLRGKETGMDLLWGYDLQDTDCQWRHVDAWPPEERLQLEATDASPVAVSDAAVHVSGEVRIDVTATAATPDPVITAILYDDGAGGERTWIGEAVLRAVLRDSLEEPSPVPPGEATQYHLQSYALDHVFQPGHKLIVELGDEPRHSLADDQQLLGVTYGAATVSLPVAPIDLLDPQPVWGPCFAC